MFSLFSTPGPSPADSARLRRIERKLDLILKHLGIPDDDPEAATGLSDEVRRLADEGQLIPAIKAYRAETGAGLREAKEAVDAYMGRR